MDDSVVEVLARMGGVATYSTRARRIVIEADSFTWHGGRADLARAAPHQTPPSSTPEPLNGPSGV